MLKGDERIHNYAKLLLMGGYGFMPSNKQHPQAEYKKNTDKRGIGWNNELWSFEPETGCWSPVCVTGSKPSPRSAHTMTTVDEKRVVLFGGHDDQKCLNDLWLFNGKKKMWTRITPSSTLWPQPRSSHTVCTLFCKDEEIKVLLMGGATGANAMEDCWIVDVMRGSSEKITFDGDEFGRYGHSAGSVTLADGTVAISAFGGRSLSSSVVSSPCFYRWSSRHSTLLHSVPAAESVVQAVALCAGINQEAKRVAVEPNDSVLSSRHDALDIPDEKRFQPRDMRYSEEADFIGRGGFAEVFKAVLTCPDGHDKAVALKKPYIMGSRFTKDELYELNREAAILLSIPCHDNIVKIIGVCDQPHHYCLVLEFVEGQDLYNLLCPASNYSDVYLVEWRNSVHRDLKPQNILVDKSSPIYVCKISDFELSKIRATSVRTTKKSNKGSLDAAGTAAYIGPEHYEAERLDMSLLLKSDVYSFGVILWQFREQKEPFGDEKDNVIRVNVKSGLPFRKAENWCLPGFEKLTEGCCSFLATNRPAFSEILRNIQQMKVKFP